MKIIDVNRVFYKVGINTFIQVIGRTVSVVMGIFTVYLLTHYLGVNGYGNYILIFTSLSIFGIFADFGLHLTVVKEIAENKKNAPILNGTYFWLKIIFSILSIIIPLIFIFVINYSFEIKLGILIGAIGISIGSLSNFNNALFQSKLRLDLITLIDLISKIVSTIFLCIFVYLRFSLIFLVASVLIGNIFSFFSSMIIAKRIYKMNYGFDINIAIKIIIMSLPVGIMSLLTLSYFKIDTIMLSIFRGQTELGYYGFSYKIFENVLTLWGFYMASVFPLLALNIHINIKKFRELLLKSIKIALISSLIIFFLFLLCSSYIIRFLGGGAFYQSSNSLIILLISCPFFFVNNIFSIYTLSPPPLS